jgi:DNA-binding response OmpR family regulator
MIDYRTLYEKTKTLSVLLVEDFEPLRREMVEVLEDLFKAVLVASDGKEALALYQNAFENNPISIDLVISDIQMPNMDGVVLTQKIRELNPEQAIIILSAHTDSKYLIELINMGISKFLTKPIQQDELFDILYRESNKKDQFKKDDSEIIMIDMGENYTWDTVTHVLKYNDTSVELTKHELILLQFFFNKVEHVCSSQNIIDYFYSCNIDINEKNIRNLVFKLRKKIPEKCIVNIYGLGYKFVLPIR